MGPSECIGSTFQKYNGPKQSNWQQHPPMQWAHLNASGVPPRNLMGPSKVIGSSIANAMGPFECIGNSLPKNNGPKGSNLQQHPQIQWALSIALPTPPPKSISP